MYQEVMAMSNTTADNGTEYKLGFNGFYYWHREGQTAKLLQGNFMSPSDALDALRRYNVSLKQSITYSSSELDELNTKSDLLGYAETRGIEIPKKHKSPLAIKKFLQGGYND